MRWTKKILWTGWLMVSFVTVLWAQVPDTTLLFTVAGEPVTVGEFKYMYLKNSRQMQGEKQNLKEYLTLYINFKLKVHEAEAQGLDTLASFRKELAGYRQQLARPYRIDPQIMDSLMREAYDHMTREVRAHHILISIRQKEDTTEAWNKIMAVRKKLLEGVPFDKMARAVSDDPSAKTNGGDIGYFTAFQLVYPFEKAAYSLPPGKLSMPVRTRYGYHIIRVDTVIPNPGEIEVAHIMIAVPRNASEKKKEAAKKKIYQIYDSLQQGGNFTTLARKFSDDYNTASQGGKLPWFGPGKMIPAFADAAFALKKVGDYTSPVRTPYGWHIIKLLDKKKLGTYQALKPELKKKVSHSDRIKIAKNIHLRNLRRKYHALADTVWLNQIIDRADVENGRITFPMTPEEKDHIILRFNDQQVPFSSFYAYLRKFGDVKNIRAHYFMWNLFNNFSDKELTDYEKAHLEEDYPEFAAVMKEYKEGMLMFNIMDKNIWSRTVKDTTGLRQFYEGHKRNYLSPEKMIMAHYILNDPAKLKKVVKDIKRKGRKTVPEDQLLGKYNRGEKNILSVSGDTLERKKGTLADTLLWKKGAIREIHRGNRVDIYKTVILIPPQPQSLDQIRGVVTSDYQDYLEKEWVKALRKKYPVIIHKEVFNKLEKELK